MNIAGRVIGFARYPVDVTHDAGDQTTRGTNRSKHQEATRGTTRIANAAATVTITDHVDRHGHGAYQRLGKGAGSR